MIHSMFHLPSPLLEKILRPMIVYLGLIAFLRIFGKRELAQLNPFDLVVLLSLSNTVQNAMIGDDNSITGGLIGALSLLTINWLLMRFLFRFPKVNASLQGSPTELICNGVLDAKALKSESLGEAELMTALYKNGIDTLSEVKRCTLEPNGTFYIERRSPAPDDLDRARIFNALEALTTEVHELRAKLAAANG